MSLGDKEVNKNDLSCSFSIKSTHKEFGRNTHIPVVLLKTILIADINNQAELNYTFPDYRKKLLTC